MRLMSFLKEAVHFVLVSFTQSDSSKVAFGLNFSFGVAVLLLYSTQISEENPESLPKPKGIVVFTKTLHFQIQF